MGDVADSMLDGTCCQICGQVLNYSGGGGFPVTCGFCNVASRKSYDCLCGASFVMLAGLTSHFTAEHAIYMQRTKSQKTTALFLPGNKMRVATVPEYLAAWDAIIQPLEELLGMKVVCYDTAIVLRDMQTGDLQELSVSMARRLVALRPTLESSGDAIHSVE